MDIVIASNTLDGVAPCVPARVTAVKHDAILGRIRSRRLSRMWNDADVLCVSLRLTSESVMKQMPGACFAAAFKASRTADSACIEGLE